MENVQTSMISFLYVMILTLLISTAVFSFSQPYKKPASHKFDFYATERPGQHQATFRLYGGSRFAFGSNSLVPASGGSTDTKQKAKAAKPASNSSKSSNKVSPPAFILPADAREVFVGNLPFTVTESEIGSLIDEKLGPGNFLRIRIAKGEKTGRPRGFLFIDCPNLASAEKCVGFLNGLWFTSITGGEERKLNSNIKDSLPPGAAAAVPVAKSRPILQNTIYLSNLDYSLTEEVVNLMCIDLVGEGLTKSVKIPLDKGNLSHRGFALVEFIDRKSAELAIANLAGVSVLERELKAVFYSPPKRPKSQQVNQQDNKNGALGLDEEFDFEE